MTIPDERYSAIQWARDFMRDLLDPKATPRVPKSVRDRARRCLRHFPGKGDMLDARKRAPDVFGEHPGDGHCHKCQLKRGGKVPKWQGAITVCNGKCEGCGKDTAIVPDSDYNWPKKRLRAIWD